MKKCSSYLLDTGVVLGIILWFLAEVVFFSLLCSVAIAVSVAKKRFSKKSFDKIKNSLRKMRGK